MQVIESKQITELAQCSNVAEIERLNVEGRFEFQSLQEAATDI